VLVKPKYITSGAALVATVLLLAYSLSAHTPTSDAEEPAVRAFLAEFISAFDNLEWDKFRNSFTDDATVLYPRGVASRADGRAQYEAHFRLVFEQIRAERTSGPYMDLQPRLESTNRRHHGYRDVSAERPARVRQPPNPDFTEARRSVEDRALACLRGCNAAGGGQEIRIPSRPRQ
jgi:hypothetical protein